MKDSEIVLAILGGGDWYDASVEHYVIHREVDMAEEKAKYDRWKKEVQGPLWKKWRENGGKPPCPNFVHFTDWLLETGTAREPNEDELAVFCE
jgi:hypothetical protein